MYCHFKYYYLKNCKYVYTIGAAIKTPSKRSKIPPCPGNIFPESLIFKLRLNIDSTKSPKVEKIETITAIVIHRVGHGGIYFWKRIINKKVYALRQRMYTEALLSLEMAETVIALLHKDGVTKYDVEIHVDIGKYGKTREMLNEIVGMIRGNGYAVRTKPDSFGASCVADRHT